MFCMYCGQQLPDGARFCLQCGTPQGAVSPTGTTQAETINLDGAHKFVPAMCPNCNAHMKVDSSLKSAHCDSCGTECLVQDAINALTVRGNVQVGSATINVNGTNTDSLLQRVEIMLADGDFSGAMSKCDTILDSDPTNGKVYLFMLLTDLKCRTRMELSQQPSFENNPYYLKAIKYGDNSLKEELRGYLNSIHKNQESPQVGDLYCFGTKNELNFWWKVLCIKEQFALLLLDDGVHSQYHMYSDNVEWKNSHLRSDLNISFIRSVFTNQETLRIIPFRRLSPSNDVPPSDKVSILNISEVEKYLNTEDSRMCKCYRQTWFSKDRQECDSYRNPPVWWLRSSKSASCRVPVVNKGKIDEFGMEVDSTRVLVRPAIWIDLNRL